MLPSFFLLGDSISIHYTPFLKKRVEPWATLTRKEGKANIESPEDDGQNGGNSTLCFQYLLKQFEKNNFMCDWVLLNCGLHDIKRSVKHPYTLHIPPEKYEANLNNIFLLMQRKNQLICWISTTPAFEEIHNKPDSTFHRYHADVMYYNAIAAELCKKFNVPIIDLYSFTLPHCPDAFCDHVHFNESFRDKQAEFLAKQMRKLV